MDPSTYRLNRRDVLKSAALAGAVGAFGLPAVGGSVAAAETTTDFLLYAVEHNNQGNAAGDEGGQSDRPDRLLVIDSTDLSDGDLNTMIEVDYFDLEVRDADGKLLQDAKLNTATLAAGYRADTSSPVVLYGIHRAGAAEAGGSASDSQAFMITVPDSGPTATVQLFGAQSAQLADIWASAIDMNGDWYGLDQSENALYQISLDSGTEGEAAEVGALLEDEQAVNPINIGMGVNFLTDELWSVFGAKDSGKSDVVRVGKDGTVETIGADVLTDGRLVGAAFGPCANVLYVVRNGSELYGYDVSDNSEEVYGTLYYDDGEGPVEVGVDNLAVPYGYTCYECEPCDVDGLLAKYEFVEGEDGEDGDFELEKGRGDYVSYTEGDYVNKGDEDGEEENEPISATFGTEFCNVYAVVKAGKDLTVQGLAVEEGEVTVTAPGKYAISFVAFFCAEQAANEFAQKFPSKGGPN